MNWIAALAVPAVCLGYGVIEARLHRVVAYSVRVLPPGADPLSILQVSDLHLRLNTKRLHAFLKSLAGHEYDLVLATGDLLGEPAAAERCADLLNGLDGRFGRFFVFGSADYYAPTFKNYLDYFTGKRRIPSRRNRTAEFHSLLTDNGWTDLTNTTINCELNGSTVQITGLDDPHLGREDRSLLVRQPDAHFALCVVHDPAPYLDAVKGGYDLIVSGHTHGGQVRLPFVGAVVTNSDVPRKYARGLSGIDGSWLFVNPGLGTGKFAPFRFLCPPEASVLNLLPKL